VAPAHQPATPARPASLAWAPAARTRKDGGLTSPFAGHVSGILSASCSAGKRRPLSRVQIKLLAQAAEDEAKEPIRR
jgi:hypothetical protein